MIKLVEVIPIVKGITRPTLSYFTKQKFSPGSFVRVPVRSGNALGIVSSSIDARQAKSALKGANFALKKLNTVEKAGNLSPAFMEAVENTAKFFAATTGSILGALIPKLLLDRPELLGKTVRETRKPSREVRLVQLGDDERYREYRGIVRECFAKDTSVMFVVSSGEEMRKASEQLSLGIDRFVFTTSNKSPKKLKMIIAEAREAKHPILFITTPSFMAFDRPDLDTFILERENSRGYRTMSRPFINFRIFLENYTRARGSSLILGDSVLSLESLWKEKGSDYVEFSPLTWRLKERSETEVIDMRAKKGFEVISPRLSGAITRALSENKRVFLFGARKAVSSSTVCGDCGSLLLCKNCKAPLVLHLPAQAGEPPIYVCHHCGARRTTETRCDNCQSWKLTPLGIGVDRITEECRKLFPNTPVYVVDKDHTSTAPKARSEIKRFEEDGGILIGTELAISHLRETALVAAVSLDSLFSIPDFFINERIFYLVTKLRGLAGERFLLQTRNAGAEILEYAAAGNILDFYRSEIKERKELKYPPFSIFIKVTTEDTEEHIEKKAVYLQDTFGKFDPHFILENRQKKSAKTLSMILRLPREKWPNEAVVEKLLLLSPDFLIKVDPESIL